MADPARSAPAYPSARPPIFPRAPLLVGFGMVALALAGAVAGRIAPTSEAPQGGTVVAQSDLLFEDRDDGAVVVRAAADHQEIEVFEGENGFLRGTLRGFARTRRAENVSPALPFRLATYADGRLTLDDPATGRHVELLAFGVDNAGVFARLLSRAEHMPAAEHAL